MTRRFGVADHRLNWGPRAIWLLCTFGLVANTESLAIMLLSKEPPVDAPTVFLLFRHKA